ncbi:2-hydroxyacid dehydrogenase [Microvirga sp. BT689]|uniref:2-hydroxyacid dehydrogenase n=1 Tax=Microvirga arvi TaxID=2778731 RepID=UPI00194E0B31|nr:2-hydroxyacid dehydrogenase [Microvirga arvi]MBM6581182.1 2-hydroxyacid dehydrogenase [Microvirga arvi]
MHCKPKILIVAEQAEEDMVKIAELCEVVYAPGADPATVSGSSPDIRGVWTLGTIGMSRQAMERLPKLEIIVVQGVGYENVDLAAAKERGIIVTTGKGANVQSVADHTLGLMLSLLRRIPEMDRDVRAGRWRDMRTRDPSLHGMVVGILGLGDIGEAIAKRAEAFGTKIIYCSRRERHDVPYAFTPDPKELAKLCDILVLSCPGGAETYHIVNREVLRELGPHGYLVNVSRGTVVDTKALIKALTTGVIAGAALDVFEDEPHVPDDLKSLSNVVLTPHVAGLSRQAMAAVVDRAISNLVAYFAGRELSARIA